MRMEHDPQRRPRFRLATLFTVTTFFGACCAIVAQMRGPLGAAALTTLCWCACGAVLARRCLRDALVTLLIAPLIGAAIWVPWSGGFRDPDYETLIGILTLANLVGTLVAASFLIARR